jgi:hypothetical protein
MCAENVRKLPGLRKMPDITIKRGYTATAEPEEPSLKKLLGKKKPPILTLKRNKGV